MAKLYLAQTIIYKITNSIIVMSYEILGLIDESNKIFILIPINKCP